MKNVFFALFLLVSISSIIYGQEVNESQDSTQEFNLDDLMGVLENPPLSEKLSNDDLTLYIFSAISLYGMTNDESLIPKIWELYEYFEQRIEPEIRFEVAQKIFNMVEQEELSINGLLPFIFRENETYIASTATMYYAHLRKPQDNILLTGPIELISYFKGNIVNNRAALFNGLLLMGDARVMELLKPIRDDLTNEEITLIVRSPSQYLQALYIEFFLDWLEELPGTVDDERFGLLAVGIARPVLTKVVDIVSEHKRIFPSPPGSDSGPVVRQYTLEEYANYISPRLRKLAEKEGSQKIIPSVMEIWGLAPN